MVHFASFTKVEINRKTKKKRRALKGKAALAKVAFCVEDSVCAALTPKGLFEQENGSRYLAKVSIPG